MCMEEQQYVPLSTAAYASNNRASTNTFDYAQHFVHLLDSGEVLCRQTCGVTERLCQEVALITQGCAQLVLHERFSAGPQAPPPRLSMPFPVQSGNLTYGTLYIALDPAQPAYPLLPVPIARALAQLCGLVLQVCEVATFLAAQSQRCGPQALRPLTRRTREVLTLMCRGYDQETIARKLHITGATVEKHRQHIYAHLGVHNERDAIMAAYQAGLFSPLAEFSD